LHKFVKFVASLQLQIKIVQMACIVQCQPRMARHSGTHYAEDML